MNTVADPIHKKDLLFTVNVLSKSDLEKLARLGLELALREGAKYDGYELETHSPFSLEHAKATLIFS